MCEKCIELDRRIDHLKRMMERFEDPETVEAGNKLIEQMEARKAAFHSEPS
jgi:hypothetical protein